LTKKENLQYLSLIEKDAQYKEVKMFDSVEEYILEKGIVKGREEERYDIITKFLNQAC